MLVQANIGPHKSAHVIVVGNEKGGSGKSTTAVHVAIALLKAGQKARLRRNANNSTSCTSASSTSPLVPSVPLRFEVWNNVRRQGALPARRIPAVSPRVHPRRFYWYANTIA